MKNINEYPYLTVTTQNGESERIENSLESVSEAICKYGMKGDVTISTDDYMVLNTFGFYVNRCSDPVYMEQLRPVLVEKQQKLEESFMGGMDESSDTPTDGIQVG